MSAATITPISNDIQDAVDSGDVNQQSASFDPENPHDTLLGAFGLSTAPKDANKAVLQGVVDQNKNLQQNSIAVASILKGQQQDQQNQINAVNQSGKDDSIIISAQQLAAQKAELASSDNAYHLGTDPSQSTYMLNDLADKLRGAISDSNAKTEQLQKNMSTSFLDNPGAWVINKNF